MATDLTPVTAAIDALNTAVTNFLASTSAEIAALKQAVADAQAQTVDLQPIVDQINSIAAKIPTA